MEETQELQISKKFWNGAYVPKHTAKLIKTGIENGTAPFIPNDGQLKTSLIYNANTGFALHGKDMIPVLLTKIEKGYESNAVGTFKTVESAQTVIKTGEKGVFYNFVGKDGEYHHAAYFFAEQTEQPERFAEYSGKNLKKMQNLSNETLKITSPEVTEYLGTYIAACKSGAKVEVSPEIAEQFKTNILAVANNELAKTEAERNPDIPRISNLLFDADKKAHEIVKSREKELGIGQKAVQEQKPHKNERNLDISIY